MKSSMAAGQPSQSKSGDSPLDKQREKGPSQGEKTPEAPKPEGEEPGGEPKQDKPGEGETPGDKEPDKGENPPPGENRPAPPRLDPGGASTSAEQDAERWGTLPERVQAVLKNQITDDLPPQYRDWIDSYYRRLNSSR